MYNIFYFLMSMIKDESEDTEKFFIERESQNYYNNILKSKQRDNMLEIKKQGYNTIKEKDNWIYKTFIGFLHEMDLLNDNDVIDALLEVIFKNTATKKICYILNNKLNDKSKILNILKKKNI